MRPILDLLGVESPLPTVCAALRHAAGALGFPVVGAFHIACADESERECVEVFQADFARVLLPALKQDLPSAFRLANLGARYEWGAVHVAEHHYALPASREAGKVLLVKVNSHVGIQPAGQGERYGKLDRYGQDSDCCGALHAMLAGAEGPFADELAEVFRSEGRDRAAALRDEDQVDPALRSLYLAVVCARLQARQVAIDLADHKPASPTLYLVVPCVTLNRTGPDNDTELICGLYRADYTGPALRATYTGLGDDPARYRLERSSAGVRIDEPGCTREREARDHRSWVIARWRERHPSAPPPDAIARFAAGDAPAHAVWRAHGALTAT
ncbi:MAG: hypothetical protein JXR96_02190 [Deltaproteobacteria bacterium]|nr:hypothetical protein [Deltaproteobacteria bacterium]